MNCHPQGPMGVVSKKIQTDTALKQAQLTKQFTTAPPMLSFVPILPSHIQYCVVGLQKWRISTIDLCFFERHFRPEKPIIRDQQIGTIVVFCFSSHAPAFYFFAEKFRCTFWLEFANFWRKDKSTI